MAFVDYMTRVVIILGAMIYPGYQSYKSVKLANVVMQQAWLKYWLVLSVVSGLMLILEPFLYQRLPVWPLWKIVVIGFLVHPKTKGYEKIYAMVLQPQLDKHEATIDDAFDKVYKAGQEHAAKVRPQVERFVQKTRDSVKGTLNKKTT